MKEKMSSIINKIPEFSDKNFALAGNVCGVLVAISAGFFVYEMFTAADFGISVQWNIFKSKWFSPLCWIGVLLAILNWGKFGSWSFKTVNVYEDRYGNRVEKDSNDISDSMMGGCLMPLIGHFIIEPIIYACIIYYPLMCVFAVLGIVLPYVITLALIGIVGAVFMCGRYASLLRCHSLILLLFTIIIGGGLTWVSLNMEQAKAPQEQQVSTPQQEQANTPQQEQTDTPQELVKDNKVTDEDDMFSDQGSEPQPSTPADDDMFNDN